LPRPAVVSGYQAARYKELLSVKVELKQGEGLVRELSIEIPAETVQTETEKKFQEVQRTTTLKGFRKGKAPLTMIRSLFAEQVKADVVDDLIKTSLPEAVKGQSLNIAARPTLTDLKFTDDGGILYVAKVEIFPEVTTVNYEGLKVTATPSATGSRVAIEVHFRLFVSFQMVMIVVLHGLCSRLKSIRFTAVSVVQPPSWVSTW